MKNIFSLLLIIGMLVFIVICLFPNEHYQATVIDKNQQQQSLVVQNGDRLICSVYVGLTKYYIYDIGDSISIKKSTMKCYLDE